MKMLEIRNYFTKELIFEADVSSSKKLVEAAVKNGRSLAFSDLRNFDLKGADLSRGDFKYAKFDGSDCKGTSFLEANCTGADFSNSCQSSANYTRAIISYADLWCANYRYSNWTDITAESIRVRATKLSHVFLGEKYGSIIKCNMPFIQISPVGMYQDCFQAFKTDKGTFIKLGNFFDRLDLFHEKLKIMKEEKKDVVEYEEIVNMILNMSKNSKETYEN